MSKRKGVSVDEKRTRLLDLFYEKKEFFQLKELEKIAPKEKGIISQSVKDVLQSLVDDGLVDSDKIGTSVYFWAFPSKAKCEKQAKLELIVSNLESNKIKLEISKEKLSNEMMGREDLEERSMAVKKLNEIKSERDALRKKLERFTGCTAKQMEALNEMNYKTKEAINRWTENVFAVKKWCSTKTSLDENSLNKQLGIPEDLDYIDM